MSMYICLFECVLYSIVMHLVQGPPGKQPLAEGGYPVEIKVNKE